MDFCSLSRTSDLDYFENVVYFVLMVEYLILAVVLSVLLKKSYKDHLLNILEFHLYLSLVLLSSILKIAMFLNFCEFKNNHSLIFIIAYELPFNSSLTLILYTWYPSSRRVMELEALMRVYQINVVSRQKFELYFIITFNTLMYVSLGIFCIFNLTQVSNFDFHLVARSFKVFLEISLAVGMIFSALKLILTIRKLMQKVSGDILLWLFVGSAACFLKASSQVILYMAEKNDIDYYWIYSFIFCLYNLDDVFPTIIFIRSFKVYPKFMESNRKTSESFDRSLDKMLETILGDSEKIVE